MKCPFCLNENIELVETWSENFQYSGPAATCLDCGLRSPVPDPNEDDVDAKAWEFWDDMADWMLYLWNPDEADLRDSYNAEFS